MEEAWLTELQRGTETLRNLAGVHHDTVAMSLASFCMSLETFLGFPHIPLGSNLIKVKNDIKVTTFYTPTTVHRIMWELMLLLAH